MTDVPDMLMNFPFLDDEGLSLPHWFFDPLFFPSSSTTFNCKLQWWLVGAKSSADYNFSKDMELRL